MHTTSGLRSTQDLRVRTCGNTTKSRRIFPLAGQASLYEGY
jgi:hypothetical protein